MKWLCRIDWLLIGWSIEASASGIPFLLPSCLSGLVVQSRKLPDTDSSPASDTEDRRFPVPRGVPSPAGVRLSRFRLRLLLKLIGRESLRSTPGVFAILSRYWGLIKKTGFVVSCVGRSDLKSTYISKKVFAFVGVSILYRVPEPVGFDDMCFSIFRFRLGGYYVFVNNLELAM